MADLLTLKKFETLSPFEIKDELIRLAKSTSRTTQSAFLNAGRGNPNWIATTPREGFFLLGQFAVTESKRVMEHPAGVGGMPAANGVAARLEAWLKKHADMPGAEFLSAMVPFAVKKFKFEPDAFVHELVDSIIGDNYPVPDRMLAHNEQIVHEYLQWAVCGNPRPSGKFILYAVEGGTAAMCYLFKSLKANRLLMPGDTIALGTPIFTPYVEMTHLDVGREDRRSERDRIPRHQQSIGLERFEKVAHRGGAALHRIEDEFAGGSRIAAHRPLQIFVHDLLVVGEHAVRHRIIVADDRVDELVHEGVRLELELLDCKRNHRREKLGSRHVGVLLEPRFQPRRDAVRGRHAADAGWVLHHALAFRDGELAEQEKPFPRRGGDPVGIAAAGVEKGGLRRPRRALGELDQLVLDLERAQGLEFFQREKIGHDALPASSYRCWTAISLAGQRRRPPPAGPL